MRTAEWTSTVSVLDRVTAVLDVFADGDVGLGVTEIATRAGLPKSTVSRLAADLVRQRCLERVGDRFYLGMRFFELGAAVSEPRRIARVARPLLVDLRARTRCAVGLSMLDAGHVVRLVDLGGDTAAPLAGEPLRAVAAGERGPIIATRETQVAAAARVPGDFPALAVTLSGDRALPAGAAEATRAAILAVRGVLEHATRR